MQLVGYSVLAVILLGSATVAVFSKSMLRAALALGVSSAALAMLFFEFGAPYAGGFELSVGAGLISVLFLMTISLTRSLEERRDDA
ncbi:MAG: NADH-quinone oxidoreductase subunit J [Anaerolineae bacterium]|nr:NADH-quinone oxidoreductase subunit J [Anaerolineae bacterium]